MSLFVYRQLNKYFLGSTTHIFFCSIFIFFTFFFSSFFFFTFLSTSSSFSSYSSASSSFWPTSSSLSSFSFFFNLPHFPFFKLHILLYLHHFDLLLLHLLHMLNLLTFSLPSFLPSFSPSLCSLPFSPLSYIVT